MAHAHGKLAAPFADVHVESGTVRVTLLHDPVVDGVDMAIYIDGSASMNDEFEYRDDLPAHDDHDDHAPPPAMLGAAMSDAGSPAKARAKKGWIAKLFGWFAGDDATHDDDGDDHEGAHGRATAGRTPGVRTNMVEPQVRRMLQYLATKDRNGTLRVAYWACGYTGAEIEAVGEISGVDAARLDVPGPKAPGSGTCLAPALSDFVKYMEAAARGGAKRGCGVFVTDGHINDLARVLKSSQEIAARIAAGTLVPLHLVLVGVGAQVSERQMEEISHLEVAGVEHLWCHRVAEEMHEMAELVSGLVDSTMTVAAGGAVYDAHGALVKRYDKRLPAVLEFALPAGHTRFSLEVDGRRYVQDLPDDDH